MNYVFRLKFVVCLVLTSALWGCGDPGVYPPQIMDMVISRKFSSEAPVYICTQTLPASKYGAVSACGDGAGTKATNIDIKKWVGYHSLCGFDKLGEQIFCVIGDYYNGRFVFSDFTRDPDHIALSFIPGKRKEALLDSFSFERGYALVEFYPNSNLGGERLCTYKLHGGGAEKVCSGAVNARSARILGFSKNYKFCFRTTADASNRCYSAGDDVSGTLVINDLNSKEHDVYKVAAKGDDIVGGITMIDYLSLKK